MEVSPLAREVMLPRLNLCPLDYRSGLRLLHPPLPAAPWARLTAHFPPTRDNLGEGELRAYHVPLECQSGLGLAPSPVARRLRQVSSEHLNLATYLLVQAYQHLWLVLSNDIYQRFTWVDHTTRS
jgi:hypothetical protein